MQVEDGERDRHLRDDEETTDRAPPPEEAIAESPFDIDRLEWEDGRLAEEDRSGAARAGKGAEERVHVIHGEVGRNQRTDEPPTGTAPAGTRGQIRAGRRRTSPSPHAQSRR